jgi:hypothetical protein
MDIITITNEWGGTLTRCEAHIEAASRFLVGRKTREVTNHLPCRDCQDEYARRAMPEKFVEAVTAPGFVYVRKCRLGHDTFRAYHRDTTSPTGVRLVADVYGDDYRALVKAGRITGLAASALSPTEPR